MEEDKEDASILKQASLIRITTLKSLLSAAAYMRPRKTSQVDAGFMMHHTPEKSGKISATGKRKSPISGHDSTTDDGFSPAAN